MFFKWFSEIKWNLKRGGRELEVKHIDKATKDGYLFFKGKGKP